MADPILIRVKGMADLWEQEQRHLSNAFARAIHESANYRPITAPKSVPHATPRADTYGSELYARLEEISARWLHWHQRAVAADAAQDWDEYARCQGMADKLWDHYLERAGKLPDTDSRPRVPAGLSGVYEVRPAPLLACLPDKEPLPLPLAAATVDTTKASAEAQAWLREYRLSGTEAMPWRYCKTRQRYYPQSNVGNVVREMLKALI